jgi:hypothetical protein
MAKGAHMAKGDVHDIGSAYKGGHVRWVGTRAANVCMPRVGTGRCVCARL